MKKLLIFLGFLSLCSADNFGIIEAIDAENKIITVNKAAIKVLPYTQIEEEVCINNGYYGHDIPRIFTDLKVGQVVEIDFMGMENNVLIAEDIEIQCTNRAY